MEYLYRFLEEKQPAVLSFTAEWAPLDEAVSVDIPTLRSGVAMIAAKLKQIERRNDVAAKSGSIAGDQFAPKMRPFHGAATKEFERLKSDHERVMKELAALAAFLGETKDSTAAFLKTLNEFRKQFMMTAKQTAARRKKEEERRKREQWKAQRAGNAKHSKHSSRSSGIPPPVPESGDDDDDAKEPPEEPLEAPQRVRRFEGTAAGGGAAKGLPPPPDSEQMLASLMRNDSEALMKIMRKRGKKNKSNTPR